CPSSLHEAFIVPLAVIWPVQEIEADMPLADFCMLLTWQSPRVCGGGPPNLSSCACVMQTSVVRGAPLKGDPGGAAMPGGNGDCCQVIVVVTSQRPAFLLCAQA